jgi:Phage integrase family
MTEKVVWHVVKQYAGKVGIVKLAPHDLRRSCARLCHSAGGELEQIQFLLGHVSVQTTEKCLGCKQRLREAVNPVRENSEQTVIIPLFFSDDTLFAARSQQLGGKRWKSTFTATIPLKSYSTEFLARFCNKLGRWGRVT